MRAIADNTLRQALASGLAQMGLALPEAGQQQLVDYVQLLHKWNAAYNLSAVRDPLQMVSRHLLDSLTLVDAIDQLPATGNILDVGTGPGLPGIPLSVYYPQRQLILLDSNGKKTRFLFQAKLALALDNVQVVQQRIADYQPATPVAMVVSRAFASLRQMLEGCDHLGAAHILAMKGEYPTQELSDLPDNWQLQSARAVTVPRETAQRHIIHLSRHSRETASA